LTTSSETNAVVCFGEMMIRLSPPGGRLLMQGQELETFFGGAEANVAVSLARLGGQAAMISVLPDNPLGRAAREELRRHSVDVRAIAFGPGRMGLYFMTPGAVLRPTEVVYDRAGSAFAQAAPDAFDWAGILEKAAWLHLSGVTPALGERCAAASSRAVEAANAAGVPVSFDGNFRAKLWAAWDGDGPKILHGLLEGASLAFVDERDIALVLGKAFLEEDPAVRRRTAAAAAFAAFPKLERIASTFRIQHGSAHYELSAVLFTRDAEHRTRAFSLPGVVDRIGAGDAFAAGVLHGLTHDLDDAQSLDFGLAATCLKHGIAGDFNLSSSSDVELFLAGGGLDVRR
jgi:2-dehydro-3-deoxygluconokinase